MCFFYLKLILGISNVHIVFVINVTTFLIVAFDVIESCKEHYYIYYEKCFFMCTFRLIQIYCMSRDICTSILKL